MRLAICNEIFSDLPLADGFRLAAQIGYQGIEIAPFTLSEDLGANAKLTDVRDLSKSARSSISSAATQAGLEVVGLHWLLAATEGLYLTSPEPQVRRRTADYLIALAELCADLGGRILVLGSPQQRNLLPGISHEQAEDFATKVISKIIPTLEDRGLTLALEPLGPAEGDFLVTAASAVRLCDMIDSPACRLHLDVKAMASEEQSIPELIRANTSHLCHFHANDPNLLGPGMGEVEFASILQALRDVNYQDWVSVEVFRYEPSREEIARLSYQNLRNAM